MSPLNVQFFLGLTIGLLGGALLIVGVVWWALSAPDQRDGGNCVPEGGWPRNSRDGQRLEIVEKAEAPL